MNGNQQTKCKQTPVGGRLGYKAHAGVLGAAAALSLLLQPASSLAIGQDAEFQDALFSPSRAMLNAERRGRVTIYDGLEHAVIERALDTQFHRIGNMMSVNSKENQPDGTVEADDDC